MRVAILTVSDRSARGERDDLSGPALQKVVHAQGWEVAATGLVPDDLDAIQTALLDWCRRGNVDIILTTGGTGFAPRDITPEATLGVIERQAPGLAEAMRAESLKVTPHAMLSRAVVGVRGQTLIINLPGNPKGVRENMEVVLPVLPHALKLLRDERIADQEHEFVEGAQ